MDPHDPRNEEMKMWLAALIAFAAGFISSGILIKAGVILV